MTRGWLAVACGLSIVLLVAQLDAGAEQRRLMQEAEAEESAFRPARAAELYREALRRDEGSRLSRRIRARLRWLEERSEGAYQPLAALMRMQAIPRDALTRAELERFARRVEGFPEGRVRHDSLALLAGAWLDRFDDPRAALEAYRAWLASPNIDEAERQRAGVGIALARARLDGEAAALAELESAGLGDRAEAVRLRARRWGAIGSVVSAVLIGAFVILAAAWGGWRGYRRALSALSPSRVVIGAYVLASPIALVWLYDRRLVPQLGRVGLAMTAVVVLAALAGAGLAQSRAPRARVRVVAALGATAVLAAGFIALDRSRLLFDILLSMEQTP